MEDQYPFLTIEANLQDIAAHAQGAAALLERLTTDPRTSEEYAHNPQPWAALCPTVWTETQDRLLALSAEADAIRVALAGYIADEHTIYALNDREVTP